MTRILLICGLVALAGCGADGLPIKPGINVGVAIGPDGIRPTARASATAGPVSVSVGG